jgi:predicted phage-related endonuclease
MVNKVTPDTMLSASRLPAVMGISKYRTANEELEHSIAALQDIEFELESKEAMEWGNQLEPIILAESAFRLELSELVIDHPEARYHDSLPLCCSLDGTGNGRGQVFTTDPDAGIFVIGQDSITLDGVGALEAKLTAMDVEDMPPLWRGPIQLQAQMDIIQAKWGAICTLYRGTQLRIFLFAPHQGTVDRIAEVSTDFQRRLDVWKQTGVVDYYPPQEGERWPDTRGLYPVNEETIRLPDTAGQLAQKILDCRAEIKKAETSIADAEKKIMQAMGQATRAIAGGYTIAWPTRSYKAQPAKTVPAKEAYTIRQSTLTIKEAKA